MIPMRARKNPLSECPRVFSTMCENENDEFFLKDRESYGFTNSAHLFGKSIRVLS